MYQQKFMPYNQMNDVYEEDEFEEEDSQPLIEQVDPHYQPTQKQVKQYAIEILGMNLPEDQRLLYLARQGLKAPIPPNWQPYQGRDGEVYYKHKITQEKTFEHPTDVEYRKKYIQQKERVARKNLKSMNLKGNPLSGLGQPLGHSALGGLGPKGINPIGLSNLSTQSNNNISKEVSKLDPRIQQKLQQELEQLEQKLKLQYEQFEQQRKNLHEKNMRKYKSDFQTNLSEMKSQKSSISSYEKSIKEEKQRVKERLKQAYDDRFKDEFVDVQKGQQKKYQEFVELYEEDNKIKLKKYEAEKEREWSERLNKLQNDEKRHEQNKREKEKQRQRIMSEVKSRYEQDDNEEIQQATRETFQKQLLSIKEANASKVREFQQKLQNEFYQMKKLLGQDPNQALQQMAQKKNRLKKMSEQKLQSLKKKQYQKVNQAFCQNLQKQIKEAQLALQTHQGKQLQTYRAQCHQRLQQTKQKLEQQMQQTLTKNVQQIYSQLKRSSSDYENQKNRKILEIREKYISEIVEKNEVKTEELNIKLGVKDKEEMIENKEELIQSLMRQVELESFVLKELRMNKAISNSASIDAQLKRLVGELRIIYKPEEFVKHEKRFNELKQKYKADKQLLASMMGQLQNTSYLNFYDRGGYPSTSGASVTSVLVKQYNSDVRIMRKNEEMLAKYEVTLRKAELNDEQALKELDEGEHVYEEISVRSSVGIGVDSEPRLQEINGSDNGPSYEGKNAPSYAVSNSYQSIQDKLKSHSKFLSNVKTQLNRKLYKVRNNNYYRV